MRRSLGLAVAVLVAAGCSGTPSPSASAASAPLSASPSATTASASAIASLATASAVATETPSVSATTTGGAWHRIGSIPTAYVGHVVAFSGGYVALAGVGRKVYVSVDGTTWHAVGLPFHATTDAQGRAMDAHASAIGSDGTTVVVVGGYGHGPCTGEPGDTGGGPDCPVAPMSWASTDGTTWRSGYPGPEPKDPAGYSQGSEFGAVWQAGTGFDAALGFWSGELASGRDVYHSTDGRSWSALAPGPALPGSSAKLLPEVHAGVADASGTRLLWELWYPRTAPGGVTTLSRSSDGESWSPAGSFDGDGVGVATALAPQATGGPWVLAGSTEDRSPIVWTSTDLETWQATLLPVLAGGADGDVGGSRLRRRSVRRGLRELGWRDRDGIDLDERGRARLVSDADGRGQRGRVRAESPRGGSGRTARRRIRPGQAGRRERGLGLALRERSGEDLSRRGTQCASRAMTRGPRSVAERERSVEAVEQALAGAERDRRDRERQLVRQS